MTQTKQQLIDLFNSPQAPAGWQKLHQSEDNCLQITQDTGLDAFVAFGETQILVESVLFPASAVKDTAALNAQILETHRLVPLTTIGTSQIGGELYYVAFGALSVDSDVSALVEEIDTLFNNVPEFLELYTPHLSQAQ